MHSANAVTTLKVLMHTAKQPEIALHGATFSSVCEPWTPGCFCTVMSVEPFGFGDSIHDLSSRRLNTSQEGKLLGTSNCVSGHLTEYLLSPCEP